MATKKTAKKQPKKAPNKPKLLLRFKARLDKYKARLDKYLAPRPHRSFRISRWAHRLLGGKPVPTVTSLVVDSFRYIWKEKKILGRLTLLYILATFMVVGGISQTDFLDLKDVSVQVFQGNIDALGSALELFMATMSGILASPLEPLPQFLAFMLIFLFWLSLIWALRMRFANEKIKVRDAVYNSGAPIVPTLLIILVIIFQLVPGAIGLMVLTIAQQSGSLIGGIEVALFATGAALLCLLSFYWVVSSMVAMIIVTLPLMYPWAALSRASELVIGQRWKIVLRMFAMFGVIMAAWAVVLIPTLILDSWLRFDWLPLIPIMAATMSGLTITYMAVYVYKLYRSLL